MSVISNVLLEIRDNFKEVNDDKYIFYSCAGKWFTMDK